MPNHVKGIANYPGEVYVIGVYGYECSPPPLGSHPDRLETYHGAVTFSFKEEAFCPTQRGIK